MNQSCRNHDCLHSSRVGELALYLDGGFFPLLLPSRLRGPLEDTELEEALRAEPWGNLKGTLGSPVGRAHSAEPSRVSGPTLPRGRSPSAELGSGFVISCRASQERAMAARASHQPGELR